MHILSILMALAAVTLVGLSRARQAWLINTWSLQYAYHVLDPVTKQSVQTEPPDGHARAAIWLASDALHSGNPSLAKTLITTQAAQGDQLAMHIMADVRLAEDDFTGALAIWKQTGDVISLLQAASQAQQAGHTEEALMAYEAAWILDSESVTLPMANFFLWYTQYYDRAENVLQQSLTTFPNSSYSILWTNRLGDALRAQKRWDEAASTYESVIAQEPDNWAAHLGLGWARYERGDGLRAAMSEFQVVIDIPESKGEGQLATALILTREKRFDEADAWFAQALFLNPDPRSWYAYRSNAAHQTGNLALVLMIYQEALARYPDFAPAYFEIAYVYQLNEQPTQAIAAIEKALELMTPPNAYYYVRAGNIYEWAGDPMQALDAYRQALLIDPQNAEAQMGIEKLEK